MSGVERCGHDPRIMARSFRALLASVLAVAIAFSIRIDLPALAAAKNENSSPVLKGLPITELTEDEAIVHALNRLTFGPRPGDVERVRQVGLAKWIDQQLNPSSLDDKSLEARLQSYPTLKMFSSKLLADYPQPKQAAKQAERQAERSRADMAASTISRDAQAQQGEGANTNTSTGQPPAQDPPDMQTPPPSAMAKAPTMDDRPLRAMDENSKRPQRIIAELAMAKITRAIYGQRQLEELIEDFWFNHFNVFVGKGEDRWLVTAYERDVIRPHTLGKFKDLVTATAKSPAMLFYLDNWLSADPRAAQRMAAERAMRRPPNRNNWPWPTQRRFPPASSPQGAQNKQRQERGLNENYARELMELHTLGVDGGYTQKDVTEVARCFTGWTIREPRRDPQFEFNEKLHDPDQKIVLGKKIHAGGMKDGEEVLALLAKHPSTARFISTKLARRFVSDNPPQSLVDRMAKTYLSSDGDIRAVLHTMIYAPEFWSRAAYRAKIKTPFELVVSTARALGTDVETPLPLVQWVGRIGEPLYQCQPPTGYSDRAETWVNTGALLNRLNYSLALAANRIRGARSDVAALLGPESAQDRKMALDRALQVFLGRQASPETVATLEKQLDSQQVLQAKLDDPVKQVDVGVIAGLVLGAPEFQRR